jgi:hypothetical protein
VFTITDKIRTIIAVAAIGTAWGSAGAASAATAAEASGPTVTPATSTITVAGNRAQDGSFRRIKVELVDESGHPLRLR